MIFFFNTLFRYFINLFYSFHYIPFPFLKGCRLEKGHIVPVQCSHSLKKKERKDHHAEPTGILCFATGEMFETEFTDWAHHCCTRNSVLLLNDEMIGHCLRMRTSHEVVKISGIFRPGFTCGTCHPCHSNFYEYIVLIRWRETPCSAVSWTLTWVACEVNHLLWLRRGSWMVFCNAGIPLESW